MDWEKNVNVTFSDTGNHYPLCSCQPAVLFGEVTPLQHRGPDLALLHMGGIAHIVFLIARVSPFIFVP